MTLFINACVRKESRTKLLADHVLSKLQDRVEEVKLEEIRFPAADEAFFQKRDALLAEGRLDDPMFSLARQFAGAETVVIAAPCYDHSFPASLKQYVEQISVVGVTFRYDKNNAVQGLCRGKALYYVTTAGGVIFDRAYGYGYIRFLAQDIFGIGKVKEYVAENLDIAGADVPEIMQKAMEDVDKEFAGR